MQLYIEREVPPNWVGLMPEEAPPEMPGLQMQTSADLGSWVSPSTLVAWVVHEVERAKWDPPNAEAYLADATEHERKTMLVVLAYAYGRQIYDNEAIRRACRTEPALLRLCGGSAPFGEELQSFRRRIRPVLEKVLVRVFMRAIAHRFDLGGLSLPVELEQDVQRLAAERLDIARHMDSR